MNNNDNTIETSATNDEATTDTVEDTRPLISVNKQKLQKLVKKAPKYALAAGIAIAGGLAVGALSKAASDDDADESQHVLIDEGIDMHRDTLDNGDPVLVIKHSDDAVESTDSDNDND